MRPKSIATVVVVLPRTRLRSSTSDETVVIAASVVSGVISEIAPTKVVLPTPKPPATTIFTGIGAVRTASGSEGAYTIDQPLDHCCVGPHVSGPVGTAHEILLTQVGHEHARHAEREAQRGGDLGNRH